MPKILNIVKENHHHKGFSTEKYNQRFIIQNILDHKNSKP